MFNSILSKGNIISGYNVKPKYMFYFSITQQWRLFKSRDSICVWTFRTNEIV